METIWSKRNITAAKRFKCSIACASGHGFEGPADLAGWLFLLYLNSRPGDFSGPIGRIAEASGNFQRATKPPSIDIECPVTNEAASDKSQTTPSPISSGLPMRPTGSAARNSCSFMPPLSTIRATIGVLIRPGQTQLTRIFFWANSRAAVLVKPTTPCFEALYAESWATPTSPAPDAVLTIAPPPI